MFSYDDCLAAVSVLSAVAIDVKNVFYNSLKNMYFCFFGSFDIFMHVLKNVFFL